MNDLRGRQRPERIEFSSSSRIIGLILTLAVIGVVGSVYMFGSSPQAPAAAIHHVAP